MIEINFYDNGIASALAVLDNGCGMNSETLKTSLKYKAPKDARLSATSQFAATSHSCHDQMEPDSSESVHPLYINSNISKFGAGLKHAAFWLGEETRIMTKMKEKENVCEVRYSREIMEAKERQENVDPWIVKQYTGQVGQFRDEEVEMSAVCKGIIREKERRNSSFTHIVIEKIRRAGDDHDSPMDLLRRDDKNGVSIERQLSHIYYYYLHGRRGMGSGEPNSNPLRIHVNRFNSKGQQISAISLGDIQEESMLDLESKFARTATAEPFLFTIEVEKYNSTNANESFKVGGIIRYHPFLYDRETNPAGIVARKHNGFVPGNGVLPSDADDEEASSVAEECGKSKEFFSIWWNGRLIPHTRLDSFNWCSPCDRIKEGDKRYKSYGRISGSLFFNSRISDITDNKLNITTTSKLVEMFNEKKTGSMQKEQPTFKRIAIIKDNLRPQRMPDARRNFRDWLDKTSQKYDKQVCYSKLLRIGEFSHHILAIEFKYVLQYCHCMPAQNSTGLQDTVKPEKIGLNEYYRYENARWDSSPEVRRELTLKVGDAVKLVSVGCPNVMGRIKSFYVDAEQCHRKGEDCSTTITEELYAPLSLFQIELLPAPYYGDGEKTIRDKEMRLIDKTTVLEAAEALIKAQFNELNMKVEPVGEMLPWRENGATLVMDALLFKKIVFDIFNEKGVSMRGVLPHYESTKTKKTIFMVARVYRLGRYKLRTPRLY